MIRAAITRLMAPAPAPADEPPMLAASTMMAEKPSQSPVADTTCTIHRRKNSWEPKRRTCHPGLSLVESG